MSLRRARLVNGLLVLLALASSATVLLTRESVTTSERMARERNVFRSWRPDDLLRLEITFDSDKPGSELVLTRIEGSGDPHDFALGDADPRKADPSAVSELLAALEYAVWVRRLEPEAVDREAMGLDAPVLDARIVFRGFEYRLRIGGQAAAPEGARYAELSGTGAPDPGVGLLAREVVEQLRVDVRAFLGRQLLPYARSEVARVELRGAGGERTLVRDERGWRLGGPEGPRADAEAVNDLFFQMARVSAARYLEAEEARRALEASPSVEVTQVPRSGSPTRVRLGAPCPGDAQSIVALRETDPELAGCVPATVFPSLTTSATDLVDRTPFPFRADEVDHVTMTEGADVLELVRSGSRFDLLKPRARELELDAGNEFVQALVSARGELVTPNLGAPGQQANQPSPSDLDAPRGTVTVRGLVDGGDDAVDLTVSYGRPDERGRVWVKRHDDGAVLLVSTSAASAFSTDSSWTRSRQLLDVPKNAIRRIAVEQGGERRVIERTGDGTLVLREPAGFEIDSGLAADWIAAVNELRVVRWLARGSSGGAAPFGAAQAGSAQRGADALRVQITYEDDGQEQTLRFGVGDRVLGGYRAELLPTEGERGAPFVLAPETQRALTLLPISRLVMTPDIEHLQKVSFTTRGVHLGLERHAGEFVATDGAFPTSSLGAIEQALEQLHPEAAIHTGPARREDGLAKPELVLRGEVRVPGKDPQTFTYRFGRVGTWQGRAVQYARADGVEATFVFERALVQRILDLL